MLPHYGLYARAILFATKVLTNLQLLPFVLIIMMRIKNRYCNRYRYLSTSSHEAYLLLLLDIAYNV